METTFGLSVDSLALHIYVCLSMGFRRHWNCNLFSREISSCVFNVHVRSVLYDEAIVLFSPFIQRSFPTHRMWMSNLPFLNLERIPTIHKHFVYEPPSPQRKNKKAIQRCVILFAVHSNRRKYPLSTPIHFNHFVVYVLVKQPNHNNNMETFKYTSIRSSTSLSLSLSLSSSVASDKYATAYTN